MVWAAIARDKKPDLIFIERNQEAKKKGYSSKSYIKALQEGLLPIYDSEEQFQRDNTKIYLANYTKTWLCENGIRPIPWPVPSPDLNPIEYV